MLQAGAMGIPFIPVRGLFGTDLLRTRTDWTVVDNPFNPGEKVVVCPPLNPTVVLFHASVADEEGNCFVPGRQDTLAAARAADTVIVTAEAVTGRRLTPRDAEGAFIPGIYVTAVVPFPRGAHPTGMPGRYDADIHHIREYVRAAKEGRFQEYLQRYVFVGEEEYRARVGIEEEGVWAPPPTPLRS
jgi:glutaconate CoA-transferase subunit A